MFVVLAACATPAVATAPAPAAAPCLGDDEVSCRAAATRACGGEACADQRVRAWCETGDAIACYTMGVAADHAWPVLTLHAPPGTDENSFTVHPDDSVAARRDFERSCQLGYSGGCVNLASLLAHGRGGPVDWGRAETLFEAACHSGNSSGCAGWATVYFEGGPPEKRDEARAAALSAPACDAGSPTACANLGFQYLNGRGVERDVSRGAELEERACRAGNGPACVNVADVVGTADEPRVTAYLLAGCEADTTSWFACGAVGRRIAEGIGIAPDVARGLAVLQRACDASYAIGCAQLGYYYDRGRVVAPDPSRAADFYARACRLGHQPSCAQTP